jgi:hypothetical protein
MYRTWYERKIKLDDGYQVSIICKQAVSYGEDEKLFECALIEPDGNVDDESVTGYLDFHQVAEYINKANKQHNFKEIL